MNMTLIELEQKIVRMREQGADNNTPIQLTIGMTTIDREINGDLKDVKCVQLSGQRYIELRG